ncbi:MAG: 1,4-dihydroxy-6-naphthoate synthase [Niabella sp.]
MTLRLGFSPCPNDTFIFDALVNGKIDTGNLHFEPVLEDVETLNRYALQGKLDITKLSYPAYFQTQNMYSLLHAGSALGNGVGPLLISANDKVFTLEEITAASIVLPGIHTTANMLFSYAYPQAKNKQYLVFHEIEDALLSGRADLGVIIHENRFTYQSKGLHKVKDLGAFWEETVHAPIPLGGIVIKKALGEAVYNEVNTLIKKSVEYSFARYPAVSDYITCHAQAMSDDVMRQHIDLYVNDFTLDLGTKGLAAIEEMGKVYNKV